MQRFAVRAPAPPVGPSAWLLLARRSRDAWLLAAASFLSAASFASFFGWNQLRVDATAYWQAGMHLRTGQPLYALVTVPALEKAYLYPPAFAAAFAPLTALPPVWGYACWMALEVVFAIALARTGAALAGLATEDTEARRTALALALAAGIVPVYDNFAEGQVNLLVAWLSCVAVLEAERGRHRRAAFALAAAVHIKIVPIVLAGAFAVWRRSGVMRWLIPALVALGLLPLAWRVTTMGFGPGTGAFGRDYVDFWHAILWPAASADHVAGVEQLFAPNFSLRATLSRLFVEGTALSPFPGQAARRGPLLLALPPPLVHVVSTGLGLGGITAALWTCQRSGDNRRRRVAAAGLLLLAGALAGPSFWEHHFVTLALPAAGLWSVLAVRSRPARLWTWVCLLAPLAATITVPFFVALFSAGLESTLYLALREYGFPTAAAVNVLVIGIVVTIHRKTPTYGRDLSGHLRRMKMDQVQTFGRLGSRPATALSTVTSLDRLEDTARGVPWFLEPVRKEGITMSYVDGFVAAVPTANRDVYKKHAQAAAVVFREHGALKVVECWGDEVPEGKLTSFPLAVKRRQDETVVFSWIAWPSRQVRDEGMKKVMADPRLRPDVNPMPFDGQRLIYGGFDVLFEM